MTSLPSPVSPKPAPAPPSLSLSFLGGFRSVWRGLVFLLRTRRSWPVAAVPAVILSVLFVAGTVAGVHFILPLLVLDLHPTSALGRFGEAFLRVVASIASVIVAALLAAWLTPPLSGPALERIILLRERSLGEPERQKVPFFVELWCGLRAQLLGLVVGLPILALLSLVSLLFPPVAVVTVPAKLFTVSLLIAWNLLDYPLSLRGLPLRERLRLLGSSAPAVLGFGVATTVLFAIPLGAIVLLPAGVAGAAELAVALERRGTHSDPALTAPGKFPHERETPGK